MRRLFAALLVLSACCAHVAEEPPPPPVRLCVTSCGLLTLDGDCEALEAFQQRILRGFARYVDNWTEPQICEAIAGWVIVTHERSIEDARCGTDAWFIAPDLCVIGYTDIRGGRIFLVDTDWAGGALAHELVHAIDFMTYRTAGHCRWRERGVKAGLLDATGRADPSVPEDDCATPEADSE